MGELMDYLLDISTHAPRTGSDQPVRAGGNSRTCYFNPRSPHGERRRINQGQLLSSQFQPTLPARGATGSLHTSTT